MDVVCPEGDDWREEISSVAVYSLGGGTLCTGWMTNNARQDGTPYFMTANHCGINSGNAASLVVYWNFETSVCGGTPDGSLAQSQTGSTFLSDYGSSDFTLVELDATPNAAFNVYYAGWDVRGATPPGAVGIHHPQGDEKAI